jgi:hypothetical protein
MGWDLIRINLAIFSLFLQAHPEQPGAYVKRTVKPGVMGLTKFNSRFLFILSAILLAAGTRFIPEPYRFFNFAPMAAMCLFGGACFSNRLTAFLIPFIALLASDAIIGFYGWGMLPVYGSYALIIGLGLLISKRINPVTVLLGSLGGSVLFFIITNFAYFYAPTIHPHNWAGIVESYTVALPYFRQTLVSDLVFNIVLFGSFYLAQLKFPRLSKI